MKYQKKVFRSGNSLAIVLSKEMLNGKGIESGDVIEIEISSIEKLYNSGELYKKKLESFRKGREKRK